MAGTHAFVAYLEGLSEDRGALAALRRGLGQAPGAVASMNRSVIPWLPANASPRVETAFFALASLFAFHPAPGGTGNMGNHFLRARRPDGSDADSVERRFTWLLGAHVDDLPGALRQAISFLKAREVGVNWHQLLFDVLDWDHEEYHVQRAWARSYWSSCVSNVTATQEE